MDLQQLSKTVAWLDDERRRDKQEMTTMQERLAALAGENAALNRRLQQLETALAATNTQLQKYAKYDEILDNYRKDVLRQLEELEKRRLESEREDDRLRRMERESISKSLAEMRKALEVTARLDRDMQARKEEEARIARLMAELQKKVMDFNKLVDERNRVVTLIEEGRRQDAKRINDLQSELPDVRKRAEEARTRVEVVEDIARRTEARIAELFLGESERKSAQAQWMEQQSITQTELTRAWNDLRAKMNSGLESLNDYAHRVTQYAEANREIKRAAEDYQQAAALLERRINELGEIQRLAEERFRQDLAAFLSDDQKRWTTHMLLRDEQWREHDRQNQKQTERLETLEGLMAQSKASLERMQALDLNRMQSLLNLIRELSAEYDQEFARMR